MWPGYACSGTTCLLPQWFLFSHIQSLWFMVWNFHQPCAVGQGLTEVGIETCEQTRDCKIKTSFEMPWPSAQTSPDCLVDVCVTWGCCRCRSLLHSEPRFTASAAYQTWYQIMRHFNLVTQTDQIDIVIGHLQTELFPLNHRAFHFVGSCPLLLKIKKMLQRGVTFWRGVMTL